MNNNPEFYSDIAERLISIIQVKLNEKPYYRDDEVIFPATNKDDATADPLEFTKGDIIDVLTACKRHLSADNERFETLIYEINKTIVKLS